EHSPTAQAARGMPAADLDASTVGPLAEGLVGKRTAESGEMKGPAARVSSGQADEVLALGLWEMPARPAGEAGGRTEAVRSQDDVVWPRLMNGLVLLSIPVLWTFWPLAGPTLRRESGRGRQEGETQPAD